MGSSSLIVGCGVSAIFTIFVRMVIVAIISFTGELGVIITVIRSIIMKEGLTIAVGKYKPSGIAAGKVTNTSNDLIRNG